MADKRISQLNSHTSPSGSDLLVIVNNNETKKITYADLTNALTASQTDISGLNAFTQSFNSFSASVHTEILAGTNEQDLSGLVTSVTLGILSGSVDGRLDHIEAKTGSLATTGSNVFRGSQTISGSLNVIIPSETATGMNENPTSNNIFWSYIPQDTNTTAIEIGWNAVADDFGSFIVTDVQYNDPFIYITLNEDVALPYRIGFVFSKPSHLWQFNENGSIVFPDNTLQTTAFTGIPIGSISSSQQITDLGFVTTTTDIADFTFSEQTISNSNITLDATNDITLHTGNGNIVLNPDGNAYIGSANAGNGIVTDGYLAGIIGDTNTVNNSTGHTLTDNLTNIINSIPTISAGTISGSTQITDLGFVSSLQTGSFATTGSNTFNGNQTINGTLTINVSTGIPTGVTNWVGQGGWNQGYYSNISTTGGTGTGLTVDVAAGGGGYIGIGQITINTPGSGYTDGDIITIDNENNLPGSFTLQVGASSLQFNSSSVEFHDLILNGTGSFQSDLTVYGNLKVWGTQSIINSTNVELSDNIIYLAPSGGGDYDLGIVGHYNDGTYRHTGIFSDASDGHAWKVFKGLTAESTGSYIDTNGVGFTLADFKANNIYGGIYATNGVISGSSQLTSSFDTRYTLSGSVQPLPSNLISSSAQITALGFVSSSTSIPAGTISGSSQLTASFDTRYLNTGGDGVISGSSQLTSSLATTGSNSFNGNQTITGSVIVSSNIQTINGYVHTSLLYNGGPIEIRSNFQPLQINSNGAGTIVNDNTQISGSLRVSGSIFSNGVGLISGSSQLTSSYDTRYTLSGSVQPLPSGLFSSSAQLPSGLISGSSQLTASYDTRYALSGSGGSIPAGTISGSSQLTSSFDGRYVQTGSFNSFTASALTTGSNSFNGNQTITGSLIVSSVAVVNGSITTPTGSLISLTSGSSIFVDASGGITGSLTGSIFGIGDVSAFSSSINTRLNNITSSATPAGTISGSSQLTASFDTRYTLSGSVGATPAGTISGSSQLTASFDTRYLTIGGLGVISGSSQLTSSFEVKGSGIYSSSAQLPAGLISGSSQLPSGLISGSSQLTASYDLRYSLSGSGGGTIPAGTISGSSQLTASYDGRYVQTGSYNSYTASINNYTASMNIWTSSIATTGSNIFNGNQTITGSLNLTNGNIVASSITANTASLYLTSGSNLYIQNNSIAEITGSLKVSGSTISLITTTLQIGTGSGDEGGEILLAKSITNNSLTGSGITIDSYQNRVRIFEQGGDARGVYIDITKAPTGVAAELMWKAGGIVNAGTFVTLDNIKATVTSSSNRGLSLATVSGTVTGYISGHYQGILSASAGTSSTTSLSTTATTSIFGWNFGQQGDMSTYILRDDTNSRVYRIILIIGASYNNNFISIERLY